MVTKKRIGIMRGGVGEQYDSSLRAGGDIIFYFQNNLGDKYKIFDILIDKSHIWHLNGLPINPGDLIDKVDVVWNTSHSSLSSVIDSIAIPYISTGSFPHAFEKSKEMLRERMRKLDISIPRSIIIPIYQADFDGPLEKYSAKEAKKIFEKFSSPWIVKSLTKDSNMGIHLVKTFPELVNAIEDGVNHQKSILVEEFISGKVVSMHSMPNFRGSEVYTFPFGNTFGNFTDTEKEKLNSLVKDLRKHIGVNHYLKTDFVLNSRGAQSKIYILGITEIPNLKPESHFAEVCELAGIKMHDVIEHILEKSV